MNQPRYSILNLFDPLTMATTPTKDPGPDREVTTPDSAAGSDKENAVPHSSHESDKLTMTTFFNRTYKMQPHPSLPLRKRLIDVGDATVTMDDASEMLSALAISERPADDMKQEDLSPRDDVSFDDYLATPVCSRRSEEEEVCTPRPSSSVKQSRLPLADISLDATPVPHKSGKATISMAAFDHQSSPTTVMRVPHPSSSVILAQSPLSHLVTTTESAQGDKEETYISKGITPEEGVIIVVSEPSETDDTLNLSTAYPLLTETHLSESALPPSPSSINRELPQDIIEDPAFLSADIRPRPRRSRSNTLSTPRGDSLDPNRFSVDLQSSFHWQMQCPDVSFDLLNDRISFFGGDSFVLPTDMDEFDGQAKDEMIEALAKRQKMKVANEQMQDNTANDAKLDLQPADYAPGSPIVTSAEKTPDSPTSSSSEELASVTQVKLATRQSLLANFASSPSVRPTKSRRASLALITHSPQVRSACGEDPVSRIQAPETSSQPPTEQTTLSLHTNNEVPTSTTPHRDLARLPMFVAPAPVHALRIVKRPKIQSEFHDGPISALSEPSRGPTSSLALGRTEVRQLPQLDSQPHAPSRPQTLHRPILKGVLRPPPGHSSTLALPPAVKPVPLVKSSTDDAPKISMKNRLTGVLGLRAKGAEPPTCYADAAVAPSVGSASTGVKARLQRPAAGPNAQSSSSSRLPSAPQAKTSTSTTRAISAPKSLRPPSHFTSNLSGSGVSTHPKPGTLPLSRLPAPGFGTQKSKLTMPGTAAVSRFGTMRR